MMDTMDHDDHVLTLCSEFKRDKITLRCIFRVLIPINENHFVFLAKP